MPKFIGMIEETDLEGGGYLFRSEPGVIYQLRGAPAELCQAGRRVEIEGDLASDSMGIAMIGEILEVKSYRFLD